MRALHKLLAHAASVAPAAELVHVVRCDRTRTERVRGTTSLLFVSRQWVLTWNNNAPLEDDMSLLTLVCAYAIPASANHITLSNFLNCSNGCSHDSASHLSGAQIPESTMLCATTPYVSMSFHAAGPGDSMPHYMSLLSRSFSFLSRSFETTSFFPPKKYALLAPVALLPAVFPIANVELHVDLLLLVRLLLWFFLRLFLLYLPQLVLLPFIISRALHAVSSGCGWCSACSWCRARCSVSGPKHDLEA